MGDKEKKNKEDAGDRKGDGKKRKEREAEMKKEEINRNKRQK